MTHLPHGFVFIEENESTNRDARVGSILSLCEPPWQLGLVHNPHTGR